MKLSDYVIEFVANAGVGHVFMLPGGFAMHLVDSLGRCPRVRFVCNLHEQACAVAADAYAQYTGRLGVALVTTGPGSTNTVTGVAASWLDSTPCLFISGQVKRADRRTGRGVRQMGFQEIEIVEIVRPITKYAVTVLEPAMIRYHLEKALHLAKSGRPGPVWIDIPLDIQAASVDPHGLAAFDPPPAVSKGAPEPDLLTTETIRLFNSAERPALLVGNGVRLAGAVSQFLELADALQVPVLTSWKAADFLAEDHPLYAGRPGIVGQRGANFTLQNCDLLLSIGARMDYGQIGYDHATVARAAKKIFVDVDAAELQKFGFVVDVSICADAGNFINALLRRRCEIMAHDRTAWLERAQGWRRRYPVLVPEYWAETGFVNPYVLVQVLSERMASTDVLVPGSSGACSELTHQAFQVKSGMRVLNSQGLGPMGFAVPAAIGACVASGERRTVVIDGDGGFHMNSQEMETVRRLGLPIKFFVLNNDGYGSIRATQDKFFEGRYVASNPASGLTLPNLGKVACAYGIRFARVSMHSELRGVVDCVLNAEGPVLCEVVVHPEHATMPRVSSYQRPDGTMVSGTLENMWPFLSEEELQSNVLVP